MQNYFLVRSHCMSPDKNKTFVKTIFKENHFVSKGYLQKISEKSKTKAVQVCGCNTQHLVYN